MYIICIKDLKSINGAKFHPIISIAKYIINLKNKIQVKHKNPSDSIFIFMDLFIPTQMLVVFNSSKGKLLYQTQVHMYIFQIYIY